MLVESALLRPDIFADTPGLFAAFTTRHFAGTEHADAERAVQALAYEEGFGEVVWAGQVHGAEVAVVHAGGRVRARDGLVTDRSGLLLSVVAADCALVLLADLEAGVVGACHSGWRGTVAGVTGETIRTMERLGAVPARIRAYVGPCISVEHFEVGEEVAAQFDAPFVHRRPEWPRPHVDLKAALAAQLRAADIPEAQTEIAAACTIGDGDRFYSYRAENGTHGRMMGLIGLRTRG